MTQQHYTRTFFVFFVFLLNIFYDLLFELIIICLKKNCFLNRRNSNTFFSVSPDRGDPGKFPDCSRRRGLLSWLLSAEGEIRGSNTHYRTFEPFDVVHVFVSAGWVTGENLRSGDSSRRRCYYDGRRETVGFFFPARSEIFAITYDRAPTRRFRLAWGTTDGPRSNDSTVRTRRFTGSSGFDGETEKKKKKENKRTIIRVHVFVFLLPFFVRPTSQTTTITQLYSKRNARAPVTRVGVKILYKMYVIPETGTVPKRTGFRNRNPLNNGNRNLTDTLI